MKVAVIAIIIAVILIAGAVLTSRNSNNNDVAVSANNNISTESGAQIVEITAKGGYSPRSTSAKADTPTIIRVKTQGTFDCSSALTVPDVGFRKNLPASGTTDIEVPAQKAGSVVQGVCAMGMYSFQVQFN